MTRVSCTSCGAPLPQGSSICDQCGEFSSAAPEARDLTLLFQPPAVDELKDRLQEATVGRYEVGERLGQGGMATVYRALDLRLRRKVALKVMAPELLRDSGMIGRFQREAQIIASLHHQHIVPVHAVEQFGDLHFFELRYVEGPTLRSLIERNGPLPIDAVKAWFAQIAEALDYAHGEGVIHRDIKPGNILIELDGKAVLTDFGIAKIEQGPRQTATGLLVGTTAYMSPEQWSETEIGPGSDQYSLGIVLYEMLSGDAPFSGTVQTLLRSHLMETPKPLGALRGDCPRDLARVVKRMLGKTPEERWGSISEAAAAAGAAKPRKGDPVFGMLAALATGAGEDVPPVQTASHPPTQSRIRTTTQRVTTAIRGRPKTAAGVVALAMALPLSVLPFLPQGEVEPVPPASPAAASLEEGVSGPPASVASSGANTDRDPVGGRETGEETVAQVDSLDPAQVGGPGENREAPTGDEPGPDLRVAGIEGIPGAVSMEVGSVETLVPEARNRSGDPLPSAAVRGRSSDPEVVAVEKVPGGLSVVGVGVGEAMLRITSGTFVREIPVSVAEESVSLVRIDPETSTLAIGGQSEFVAQVQGVEGLPLLRQVTWESTRPEVATVHPNSGLVSGVGPGEALIIAEAGERRDTALVRVEAASPAAEVVELSVGELELAEGPDDAAIIRTAVSLNVRGGPGASWCAAATFRSGGGATSLEVRGFDPSTTDRSAQIGFSSLLSDLGLERGDSFKTDSISATVRVWDQPCGSGEPREDPLDSAPTRILCLRKLSPMAGWGTCG